MPTPLINPVTKAVALRAARYAAKRYGAEAVARLKSGELDVKELKDELRERFADGNVKEGLAAAGHELKVGLLKHKDQASKRASNWLSPAEFSVSQEGDYWAVRKLAGPRPAALFAEAKEAVAWASLLVSHAGGGTVHVYGEDDFHESVKVPRGLSLADFDVE